MRYDSIYLYLFFFSFFSLSFAFPFSFNFIFFPSRSRWETVQSGFTFPPLSFCFYRFHFLLTLLYFLSYTDEIESNLALSQSSLFVLFSSFSLITFLSDARKTRLYIIFSTLVHFYFFLFTSIYLIFSKKLYAFSIFIFFYKLFMPQKIASFSSVLCFFSAFRLILYLLVIILFLFFQHSSLIFLWVFFLPRHSVIRALYLSSCFFFSYLFNYFHSLRFITSLSTSPPVWYLHSAIIYLQH